MCPLGAGPTGRSRCRNRNLLPRLRRPDVPDHRRFWNGANDYHGDDKQLEFGPMGLHGLIIGTIPGRIIISRHSAQVFLAKLAHTTRLVPGDIDDGLAVYCATFSGVYLLPNSGNRYSEYGGICNLLSTKNRYPGGRKCCSFFLQLGDGYSGAYR